ncbi:unnamed protein product [Spirodela intermedia]|uniref:Uncharacterized protein n=2 Tax=Spirodela intermedia TaxID=51605 RepID=A0A7I8IVT4_SPIIN|nr:unnamed protein product [Spirodela intermedia]CAA6662107.1 unnamed protein product [Spirodela intermedia]
MRRWGAPSAGGSGPGGERSMGKGRRRGGRSGG